LRGRFPADIGEAPCRQAAYAGIRIRSNSLPAICRELGIRSTFHRAEADAWAAGKLLLHLCE
jgi:DNA polymerase III epsilon subunit-like protein